MSFFSFFNVKVYFRQLALAQVDFDFNIYIIFSTVTSVRSSGAPGCQRTFSFPMFVSFSQYIKLFFEDVDFNIKLSVLT